MCRKKKNGSLTHPGLEIDREVKVTVGTAVICRMVENATNPAKNWVRPSQSDSILEFPASSLLMHTRQAVSGPKRKGEHNCRLIK